MPSLVAIALQGPLKWPFTLAPSRPMGPQRSMVQFPLRQTVRLSGQVGVAVQGYSQTTPKFASFTQRNPVPQAPPSPQGVNSVGSIVGQPAPVLPPLVVPALEVPGPLVPDEPVPVPLVEGTEPVVPVVPVDEELDVEVPDEEQPTPTAPMLTAIDQ